MEEGTHLIYLGPHRPWRRSVLSGASMYSLPYGYHQFLEMDTFPGFQQFVPQGMQALQYLSGHARTPDTADESHAFVKYSISRSG